MIPTIRNIPVYEAIQIYSNSKDSDKSERCERCFGKKKKIVKTVLKFERQISIGRP